MGFLRWFRGRDQKWPTVVFGRGMVGINLAATGPGERYGGIALTRLKVPGEMEPGTRWARDGEVLAVLWFENVEGAEALRDTLNELISGMCCGRVAVESPATGG